MIGSIELIAILVAALFLFGPNKLPELARSLGSAMGEFKKAQLASEMQLTHFDSYTQKAENKYVPKDQEEGNEINEAIPNEKAEKLEVNL
jgi:sec-independent protein translocase protein TatA